MRCVSVCVCVSECPCFTRSRHVPHPTLLAARSSPANKENDKPFARLEHFSGTRRSEKRKRLNLAHSRLVLAASRPCLGESNRKGDSRPVHRILSRAVSFVLAHRCVVGLCANRVCDSFQVHNPSRVSRCYRENKTHIWVM